MSEHSLPSRPEEIPEAPAAPAAKEKRSLSAVEKLLLPVTLVIAVLCDRLLFAPIFRDSDYVTGLAGIFWLCYLAIFYAFYWRKIFHNRVLWYVAGCCGALCLWSFFVGGEFYNLEYSLLTYMVIPAVLMAHAQYAAGSYRLKDAGVLASAWILGWMIKPFSGLPTFFGAVGSLFLGESKSTAKKAAFGIGITLPLLCVIIPLLGGADWVFGYYLDRLIGSWNLSSIVGHMLVIIIAFGLFYSFFWNVGFGINEKPAQKTAAQIDPIICHIALGSITLVYLLFCGVQFTYLFAGAGLPNGMTYSEYAREGFAQTIAVCGINLLLFGVFLQFGKKQKAVSIFLAGLLGLTGVMLFSGFLRLKLYIDAYGLTWLRLLSAWFVIYLAIVILLCAVRMVKEKLPAIALCALILLGWYVALGYSNPDALVSRYNQSHSYDMPSN